ncbi:MAG: serine protease [bacterium]
MSLELQNSVVIITGSDPDRFGTGFVILKDQSTTYLLTCMHVIKEVGGEDGLKADGYTASLVVSDAEEGVDLAVLSVDTILGVSPLRLSATAEKGGAIITTGFYAYGKQHLIQDLQGVLAVRSKVHSLGLMTRCTCWHLEIKGDNHLQPGFSGAPVIDEKSNEVIAIVNQRKGEGQKGLAISVEALLKLWPELPEALRSSLQISPKVFFPNIESGPLMNFEEELGAFRRIASGEDLQTRLISVHGPSGMGKSRLLGEYQRVARTNHLQLVLFDLKQRFDIEDCLEKIIDAIRGYYFAKYDEFISIGRPEPLTREKEREWYRILTRKFFNDLNGFREAPRLAVFFDHYEKADDYFRDWLNHVFLQRVFSYTLLIVVIGGQEEIETDPSWAGQHRFHLNGLSVDSYHRYVAECQVEIAPHEIEFAHRLSNGRPNDFVKFVQSKMLITRGEHDR